MATAFQANAFQINAFQIGTATLERQPDRGFDETMMAFARERRRNREEREIIEILEIEATLMKRAIKRILQ